jgi:glycosyltransferase involved in cell wall biosynthesis
VYDAHEDTPLQISYQHWLPSLLKKPYALFYFLLEKFCGWIFDAIIVAEPVIAKYFPEKKTYLVRNFPIAKSFESRSSIPYENRPSKMVHVGTLSEVRGLIEMLEGVRAARQFVDVEFVLGGKFAPASLEQRVTGEYHVTYLSWLSYPALVDLLYTARIGIIIPHPIPRYKTNYPVKLFEFMASGLPVIASAEGEAAAFVKEGECGILVDPSDIGEIANAIRWLLEHGDEAEAMGKRGQMLIFSKYNWENEAKVLLQVYYRM